MLSVPELFWFALINPFHQYLEEKRIFLKNLEDTPLNIMFVRLKENIRLSNFGRNGVLSRLYSSEEISYKILEYTPLISCL